MINTGKRASVPHEKLVQSEHDEQSKVISWAREVERFVPSVGWLFAIPNGAKLPYGKKKRGGRYAPQASKLIAEGLTAGVSDLMLPYPSSGFCGLFIEMKVGYNKPTDSQVQFLEDMNQRGYLATACWSATQAIMTICLYLGLESEGNYI